MVDEMVAFTKAMLCSQFGDVPITKKTSSLTSKGTGATVRAKLLARGLDISRLRRLGKRNAPFTYSISSCRSLRPRFSSPSINLSNASDYALLDSSRCQRLPGGPFAVQFRVLKDAMATLTFKQRRKEGVWGLISALLMIRNIELEDALSKRDIQAGYVGDAKWIGRTSWRDKKK
jgi:hypothetical protein